MKITLSKPQASKGFTLIEMIGVLAVIAILASLLIPKIFEAINNARVNNAAVSIQTVKTAVADHYAKYGSLIIDGTTGNPVTFASGVSANYDNVLLQEGFLDKVFATKISSPTVGVATGTRVDLLQATSLTLGTPVTANTAAFDLDFDNNNDVVGSAAVVAILPGVTLEDARALNRLIDGSTAEGADSGNTATYQSDLTGRVKWGPPANGGICELYVYVTHR